MKAFVPVENIQQLEVGDHVLNIGSGNVYVIIHLHGSHAVAVRSVDVSNPSEWSVLRELKKENPNGS